MGAASRRIFSSARSANAEDDEALCDAAHAGALHRARTAAAKMCIVMDGSRACPDRPDRPDRLRQERVVALSEGDHHINRIAYSVY